VALWENRTLVMMPDWLVDYRHATSLFRFSSIQPELLDSVTPFHSQTIVSYRDASAEAVHCSDE
jgi:hypothetical protein